MHDNNYVVVLDPGHGGENLGGQTDSYIEQELTLKVAHYMKERLSKYDGVEVYLTHDEIGTKDISRKDRAKIASEHDADLMISLHFNMSENHTLFGTEAWTSAFGKYYSIGNEFAHIWINDMVNEFGFFDRGVKTRIGKSGDDYYGIILSGKNNDIPTVILEHCHLDEIRDYEFLESSTSPYELLGNVDADAVAKFFELSSKELEMDYTGFSRETFEVPEGKVMPDSSEPELAKIEFVDTLSDEVTGLVNIKSIDSDSGIQYYCYSYDGKEYSGLYPWNSDINAVRPIDTDEITVEIPLPTDESKCSLTVKTYNRYDLCLESNSINMPLAKVIEADILESNDSDLSDGYSEEITEVSYSYPKLNKLDTFDKIIINVFVGISIVLLVTIIYLLSKLSSRKRRRRRKK